MLAKAAESTCAHPSIAVNGGWGEAPKFPAPLALEFLLSRQTLQRLSEAEIDRSASLDAMAAGGIYDHLGGGFHRYSSGRTLARAPLREDALRQRPACPVLPARLATAGRARYRRVAEETLDYLLRRMSHAGGGFFSAEDADSQGKEGAFYVWTHGSDPRRPDRQRKLDLFETTYGVTADG